MLSNTNFVILILFSQENSQMSDDGWNIFQKFEAPQISRAYLMSDCNIVDLIRIFFQISKCWYCCNLELLGLLSIKWAIFYIKFHLCCILLPSQCLDNKKDWLWIEGYYKKWNQCFSFLTIRKRNDFCSSQF